MAGCTGEERTFLHRKGRRILAALLAGFSCLPLAATAAADPYAEVAARLESDLRRLDGCDATWRIKVHRSESSKLAALFPKRVLAAAWRCGAAARDLVEFKVSAWGALLHGGASRYLLGGVERTVLALMRLTATLQRRGQVWIVVGRKRRRWAPDLYKVTAVVDNIVLEKSPAGEYLPRRVGRGRGGVTTESMGEYTILTLPSWIREKCRR